MLNADLAHLTARSCLHRLLQALRHLPRHDARSGILHIDGEPIVVPRHWCCRFTARQVDRLLRTLWAAITACPLHNELDQRSVIVWGTELQIGDAAEYMPVPAPVASVRHWPEHFDDGDEPPATEDDEIPWRQFPDLLPRLPTRLRQLLAGQLAAFMEDSATAAGADDEFIGELADTLLHALQQRISADHLRECLMVLAAGDDEVLAGVLAQLPGDSELLQRIARVSAAQQEAASWTGPQRHLAAFVPFVLFAADDATPEAVTTWLRDNGLSAKGLARLHRLPLPLLEQMADHWLWHPLYGWQACVHWLERLLAALHAHRQCNIDDQRLQAAAMIAAHIGAVSAVTPEQRDAMKPPRDYLFLTPRDFPEAQRQDEHDAADHANQGAYFILTDAAQCIDSLANDAPGAAGTFAQTLIHTLLGATPVRQAQLRRHIGDVRDWICGDGMFCGSSAAIAPADLGPSWQVLMRGQRRWHASVHDTRMRLQAQLQHHRSLPDASWPTLCPAFTCGTHRVLPLDSAAALAEEGTTMQHCVAGYASQCLRGDCRIFSIRSTIDDVRLATAEFRAHGGHWVLVQLRGARNRELLQRDHSVIEPLAGVTAELERRLNALPVTTQAGLR